MPFLLYACWVLIVAHEASAHEILFANSRLKEPKVEWSARSNTSGALGEMEIEIQLGGIELTEVSGGYQVSSKGLSPLGAVGAPDVGVTGILLAAPPGVQPQLELLAPPTETWIESTPVAPCQAKTRCDLPAQKPLAVRQNKLYRSDTLFPKKAVSLQPLGNVQNIRFYRIAIAPIQTLPRSKTLKVTSEMKLGLRFEGAPTPFTITPSVRSLLSTAVNGAEVSRLALPLLAPETMIVLSADSLKSSVESFVEWKRQKGLRVEHYSASEAGATKEKIQAFIQSRYDSLPRKPSFLLLVGNKKTLPGFLEKTAQGFAASDYSYTLLEGGDYLPDILQGRLLANSKDEVDTQIARWMAYEKSPSGTWYVNATTIASDEGTNPSDEGYASQISEALTNHSYQSVDKFFQRDGSATAFNFVSAIERGRSWVAYFGHGSGYDWASMNDEFSVDQIAQLTNFKQWPFVVDVACQNGSWMDIDDSFGKAWVSTRQNTNPAGAVAYLGGSVNISWHEPATMSVGIAKYHFDRSAQTVGASVFAGQIYLMEQMGLAPNTIDNLKWFNLFGDPSLLLRTAAAKAYAVKQTTTRKGNDWVISVQATDTLGNPVEGVQFAASAPGYAEPLSSGTTSPQGEITLRIVDSPNIPTGSLLTASGYNLETYQWPIEEP